VNRGIKNGWFLKGANEKTKAREDHIDVIDKPKHAFVFRFDVLVPQTLKIPIVGADSLKSLEQSVQSYKNVGLMLNDHLVTEGPSARDHRHSNQPDEIAEKIDGVLKADAERREPVLDANRVRKPGQDGVGREVEGKITGLFH
jgi:hypothetical protein